MSYKTMGKNYVTLVVLFWKIDTCLEELTFNPQYVILATLGTHYEHTKELFSCSFCPST